MVFFYKIRGGPCKGELSHITLRQEDVICYVGRDKYENEALIAHGWPGDIWFHVDSVSSAHVYFRLNYDVAAAHHGNDQIPLTGAIPMDCLPENSIEDMMQIVKHNSIEGSKMASAKIVWTPHSNLKKNFDMEVGQVTYHDTKLCRYGRCHKDRARIKALEKSKSIDHTDIDLYAEKKKNERALIERRKQHKKSLARKGDGDDGLFDPIELDRKLTLYKQTRQGDEQSGIDKGVAALESLALGDPSVIFPPAFSNGDRLQNTTNPNSEGKNDSENTPIWKREYELNDHDYGDNEMALFLLERGYPRSSVVEVMRQMRTATNVEALRKLWFGLGNFPQAESLRPEINHEELLAARQEEKEVLEAIFGEDVEWIAIDNCESETSPKFILDLSVPITTYVPPERYHHESDPPPELRLEVYASPTNYPFGNEAPVLALVGGGIPQEYLHKMTVQLHEEASMKATEEEPGSPYLFTLLTHVGEMWESIVEEERAAVVKANEEARKARIDALREQQAEHQASFAQSGETSTQSIPIPSSGKFATEHERRAYAASVVAKSRSGRPANDQSNSSNPLLTKDKKYYDSGVSDASLIDDLFS
ncbi:protein of unknown function DUF814 containing protein [Nitzschia inconspicua]|uniref:RWD domain-containing protein n=1 Tax=Nitzschia inconspicua TaxID=303405 RepID=A0A9K3PJN5_9STRA|nr:protein of unknown function DUF814 containing protein [Nitzschia inconspicua]